MAHTIDRLSVKIALLSLMTNLPEQPSTNTPSQYLDVHKSQPSKTIPFKHEVLIAQQLSFICAYSDDPLHVLATCIEENCSKDCLIIRLAANTGTHGVLLDGLRIVSGILQNEALNGLTSLMDYCFTILTS
jgi:hypothetical protein